jgi:lysine-N-methylase
MLSNTCANYPRYNTTIAGITQQGLTLSCPEAARLALLAGDAFEFTQAEQVLRTETIDTWTGKFGFTADQVNEARFFALKLIRTPTLELWEKQAVLGVYCERLEDLIQNKTTTTLSDAIAGMQGVVDSGLITDTLRQMQPDHSLQAVLFANIWKIKKGGLSQAQKRQMSFMLQGLGVSTESEEISQEALTDRYRQGLEKLSRVLETVPHLLENYVANEMFRELFPFGTTSPVNHYLRLMTRYGVVRWMLAMRCMADSALPSPEDLVETVQVFCKRYQHDSNFAKMIDEAFHKAGWDQVGKIYRFLRS